MTDSAAPKTGLSARLLSGLVIPAHPLALTSERKIDERRQRGLTRYYLAAGAGGLAVAVHSTQFEIHDPSTGLLRPVLELAGEEVRRLRSGKTPRPVLVAGLVGRTEQALSEAALARDLGYDCGMLSLGAMKSAGDEELIAHCRAVARDDSALRVLPPARRRRPPAELFVLAEIRGDPRGRGRQDRAVQPLPDARRRPGRRRVRPRRRDRALYRERRQYRRRPGDGIPLPLGRPAAERPHRRRPPGTVGGLDPESRGDPRGNEGDRVDRARSPAPC